MNGLPAADLPAAFHAATPPSWHLFSPSPQTSTVGSQSWGSSCRLRCPVPASCTCLRPGCDTLPSPAPHASPGAAVIPPPLCAASAALPAPVNCLAIRDFGECEVRGQLEWVNSGPWRGGRVACREPELVLLGRGSETGNEAVWGVEHGRKLLRFSWWEGQWAILQRPLAVQLTDAVPRLLLPA